MQDVCWAIFDNFICYLRRAVEAPGLFLMMLFYSSLSLYTVTSCFHSIRINDVFSIVFAAQCEWSAYDECQLHAAFSASSRNRIEFIRLLIAKFWVMFIKTDRLDSVGGCSLRGWLRVAGVGVWCC